MKNKEKLVFLEKVSFRELTKEIISTTYATHGLHTYPAKFIPQVVRYYITKYTKPNNLILDPFGGSGTVSIEASLTGRNSLVLDINPITELLVKCKTKIINENPIKLYSLMNKEIENMFSYKGELYEPNWKSVNKWIEPVFLPFLKRIFGYIHFECTSELKDLLLLVGLNLSRFLATTDDRIPKLYKSPKAKQRIEQLKNKNWEKVCRNRAENIGKKYVRSIIEYNRLSPIGFHDVIVPQDIIDWKFEGKVDAVLTSPPYMQAQEYIRSFKIDLCWLGYSEDDMRQLKGLEIPYRKAPEKISTPTIDLVRKKIEDITINKAKSMVLSRKNWSYDDFEIKKKGWLKIYDSYFYYLLKGLANVGNYLKEGSFLGVFVGNPKMQGYEVEIWRVLYEYLSQFGFEIVKVYKDRIKSKNLFKGRNNLNPNGMQYEFLTILQKTGQPHDPYPIKYIETYTSNSLHSFLD